MSTGQQRRTFDDLNLVTIQSMVGDRLDRSEHMALFGAARGSNHSEKKENETKKAHLEKLS